MVSSASLVSRQTGSRLVAPDSAQPGASWSAERAIWRGMLSVMVFVVLAKCVAAAKEIVVAWRFGVGDTTDAYMFLFTLVNWPVGLWTSVLPALILPLAARLQLQDETESAAFRSQLLGLTVLGGLGLLVLAWVGLPWLIASGATGLGSEAAQIALHIAPALEWSLPLGMLVAVYATWTMSEGRHLNTLAEGVPALGVLVAVFFAGSALVWAWGTTIGVAGQAVVLWLALGVRKRAGVTFRLKSPYWRLFAHGFTVMLAAQLLMSFTTVADQFFASRLGAGAISTLGYANRVIGLGLTLGATAVTRATLPVFSRLSAEDDQLPDSVVQRWTLRVLGGATLAAAAGWLAAPAVVAWLFQRGQFTAVHTAQVAEAIRYGLFQVPFYASGLVLTSASASRGRYGILLATGAAGLAVKLLANLILIPLFSINALMLSSAAVQAVNAGILWGTRKGTKRWKS